MAVKRLEDVRERVREQPVKALAGVEGRRIGVAPEAEAGDLDLGQVEPAAIAAQLDLGLKLAPRAPA